MRNESRVLTVENANYDAVTLNNDHRHINEQPTNPIDDGQNMQKLLFLCRRCHEIFQQFFSLSQDRAAGHLAADRATCLLRKNSTFVLTSLVVFRKAKGNRKDPLRYVVFYL